MERGNVENLKDNPDKMRIRTKSNLDYTKSPNLDKTCTLLKNVYYRQVKSKEHIICRKKIAVCPQLLESYACNERLKSAQENLRLNRVLITNRIDLSYLKSCMNY